MGSDSWRFASEEERWRRQMLKERGKEVRRARKARGEKAPGNKFFWSDVVWPFLRGLLIVLAFLAAGGLGVAISTGWN